MSRMVAVTGMGTVGSHGCGRTELVRALLESVPLTSDVDRSEGYHRPGGACTAALARCKDLSSWISSRDARRMSSSSRFAVAAANMAWADAGLTASDVGLRDTAVSMATCFGPVCASAQILEQIHAVGPEMVSPFLFTESVANAPASQIAITYRAGEGNFTYTQREAGPLTAVLRGVAEIQSGRAERVLVGSVDELNPLTHAILDRFGALAQRNGGEAEESRPFDARRNGFLFGEGATILVLEADNVADARGAQILALIRGGGQANDPTATASAWGTNHEALGGALSGCLRRMSVEPANVDRIVSGASGSVGGDRLEALTLRSAWAEVDLPPILVPKAVTGEYGGGFLASLMLALEGATFGPTAGFQEPDPLLGIVPHDGRRLEAPRMVLASTLASGGLAAWVILERP